MKKILTILALFWLYSGYTVLAEPATLIGSEQCFMCHDTQKEAWGANPHRAIKEECEACHGPGSAHQDSGGEKKLIKRNPGEEVCDRCHLTNSTIEAASNPRKLSRKLWENSVHQQMGFSCLNCHDPHKIKNYRLLKINGIKWNCYVCHADKKKTFEASLHCQNGFRCNDCHLPHCSENNHLLKGSE